MDDIKIAKKTFIRSAGKDEYWLQDKIYENPSILGLGELKSVNKEKCQSSGGRLDILLKDQEDNNAMYEVEVMLGETDPSHIIRSIEYWDNEKRKYPLRQHYAVLIAESFDRRYFNVIQLLSLNIPMIAIQVDLLEVNNEYVLNFTKILNIYEEPEDDEDGTVVGEPWWISKSTWTLKTAKELLEVISVKDKSLNFTQSYIGITIDGQKNTYALDRRTEPKSVLWFHVKDEETSEAIKMALDKENIVYTYNKDKFKFIVEDRMIKDKQKMFQDITDLRGKGVSAG